MHIDLRRQALIDRGMDPREAEYEARRRFGNVVSRREQSREAWAFPALEAVAADLRYAARLLRRSPVFTLVAIVSLSIGIGASVAVFTLADAVLMQKLPVREPDELRVLQWRGTGRMPAPSLTGNWTRDESSSYSTSFALPTFQALRAEAPKGVQIIGFAGFMSLNVAIDGAPETVDGQAVSSIFSMRSGSCQPRAGRSPNRTTAPAPRPSPYQRSVLARAFRLVARRDRPCDHRQRVPRHDRRRHAAWLPQHAASRRSAGPGRPPRVSGRSRARAQLPRSSRVVGPVDGTPAPRRGLRGCAIDARGHHAPDNC